MTAGERNINALESIKNIKKSCIIYTYCQNPNQSWYQDHSLIASVRFSISFPRIPLYFSFLLYTIMRNSPFLFFLFFFLFLMHFFNYVIHESIYQLIRIQIKVGIETIPIWVPHAFIFPPSNPHINISSHLCRIAHATMGTYPFPVSTLSLQ